MRSNPNDCGLISKERVPARYVRDLVVSDFLVSGGYSLHVECVVDLLWFILKKMSEDSHLVMKSVLRFLFELCCVSWICPWNDFEILN